MKEGECFIRCLYVHLFHTSLTKERVFCFECSREHIAWYLIDMFCSFVGAYVAISFFP
jgi:hypothetical protein